MLNSEHYRLGLAAMRAFEELRRASAWVDASQPLNNFFLYTKDSAHRLEITNPPKLRGNSPSGQERDAQHQGRGSSHDENKKMPGNDVPGKVDGMPYTFPKNMPNVAALFLHAEAVLLGRRSAAFVPSKG